jgi:hypothetical protein
MVPGVEKNKQGKKELLEKKLSKKKKMEMRSLTRHFELLDYPTTRYRPMAYVDDFCQT